MLHLSIFQQKIVEKLELDKVFDEGNDDETKEWIMFKEGGRNTYSAITHVPELLAIVVERIPDQSFIKSIGPMKSLIKEKTLLRFVIALII